MNSRYLLVAFVVVLLIGCGRREPGERHVVNKPITVHPVFGTSVTGEATSRPAVQVDIKNDREHWFLKAELYLTVQSSRFPSDTWIVMPLNVGDFAGCRTRFVQLPFEVQADETVLFNLLDDDRLTKDEEKLILRGCRAGGYCILAGGALYSPTAANIARPAVTVAADLLGDAVVQDFALHGFKNRGTAEYIAPRYLPSEPHQANELSLRDDSNYVRAVIKLYGPPDDLQFSYSTTPDET